MPYTTLLPYCCFYTSIKTHAELKLKPNMIINVKYAEKITSKSKPDNENTINLCCTRLVSLYGFAVEGESHTDRRKELAFMYMN